MNYLAHAALAGSNSQFIVGNLIADHVKGPDLTHLPDLVAYGVQLHRAVDVHFDHQTEVTNLRALLPQGYRRFAGIALDFLFDHLLAQHWSMFYTQSLEQFQNQVNQVICQQWQIIPDSQKPFMTYLIETHLFLQYRHQEQIQRNLKLLSRRIKNGDNLIECMNQLTKKRTRIEEVFPIVYKQMTGFAKSRQKTLVEP